MRYLKIIQFLLVVILSLNGCSKQFFGSESLKESPLSSEGMYWLDRDFSEIFQGDMLDRASLVQAANASIQYYERLPSNVLFKYGNISYTATEMVASMKLFVEILEGQNNRDDFVDLLQKNFMIFASAANEDQGVLFTGYYEPIFPGQLKRDQEYKIPVYRRPDDLEVLDLGDFRSSLNKRTIVYKVEKGAPVPYLSRQQIMGENALAGKGLEIAWMKDPVDLFFLQVQGSGILVAPDGSRVKVGYDGSNGRPYNSIGRYLIDQGAMRLSEISMGSIRRYMRDNPLLRDSILYHNESYVFFKLNQLSSGGPHGNIDVSLTPLRSVAADATAFPKGGLAYIVTEVPDFDENWTHHGNKPVSHFVLVQDTGGAIKGPGRLDLFWGNGELAENSAGAMRSLGKVYFFVAKKEALQGRL